MARRTPPPAAGTTTQRADLYEAIGGTAACRELSAAFYARVDRDPRLRPLFPGKTLRCATEEFAAFLVQFLGGPAEDTQRRWWLSLRESHLRFKIGRRERDAWMSNMSKALDDAQTQEPVRSVLHAFFERSSAYVVNQGPESPVPDGTHGDGLHEDIARRWDAQRALDEAVAAVRSGDVEQAIRLAENDPLQSCECAVFAGLLAVMISSGHSGLLGYVHDALTRDPGLAQKHYAGRTLLYEAAGRHSRGSKGLTPLLVARSPAMKRLLQSGDVL